MVAIVDKFKIGEQVKVKDRTYGCYKLVGWKGHFAILHHFAFSLNDTFYREHAVKKSLLQKL